MSSNLDRRLQIEERLRLFSQLHQNDDPVWYRSAGGMYCSYCGLTYRQHFDNLEHPGFDGSCDKRLCNGDIVHL